MKKSVNFIFGTKSIKIFNIDPSNPNQSIDKDWDQLQQEIFDQIDDSKQFSSDELDIIADLSTKDFLKCLRDDDENTTCYNRARAIYEYKAELESAIKNNEKTEHWSLGLDKLRQGAVAEEFNY